MAHQEPQAPQALQESTGARTAPTVGFDLDMTLIDSRPGIRAVYVALTAETGVPIDADLAVSRLGPPLEHEIAEWFPAERVDEMVARYRALYPAYAIETSLPLPGARDAIQAVRDAGGRTLVVTAKNEPHARRHLDHLGIEPDEVIGGLWAEGKATALRAHGAGVYVGDHLGDVRGAEAAGALSVAVATGPYTPEELRAGGADVVLTDLTDFRAWWAGHLDGGVAGNGA
ncbi:HAD family hydrolase [Streptomyces sp. NPDC090025]|uniref:HAD family hydrolase n=1 Tax=Streptomyces sp. NPDC090025 TaxID=3365922 RepID=UPI003835EA80